MKIGGRNQKSKRQNLRQNETHYENIVYNVNIYDKTPTSQQNSN